MGKELTQFKEGNAGKPKGTVNKLTRSFREALTEAFNELQKDPEANLVVWGKKNTTAFYMIASKLIPTEINHSLDNKVIRVITPVKPEGITDAEVIP